MPRPNPYTPEVKASILSEYVSGSSTHALLAKYGGSRKLIVKNLQAAGIQLRTAAERQHRLPIRDDAFANAEADDEAAYWVGVMMADGCVYAQKGGNYRGECHYLHLGFHAKDVEHLKKFLAFLGSSHKIIRASTLRDPVGSRPPVRVDMCEVRIGSRRLVADLAKYGVVPRKSKTAAVIGLDNNRHFWRGVVDGDGNLRWRTDSTLPNQFPRPTLQVVGSEPLMKQFENYLRAVIGTNAKAHVTNGCWGYNLNSNQAVRAISHLYMDCESALDRKLSIAHDILCAWELRPQAQRQPKVHSSTCTRKGCGQHAHSRGLCEPHYLQLREAETAACLRYRAKRVLAFHVPSA